MNEAAPPHRLRRHLVVALLAGLVPASPGGAAADVFQGDYAAAVLGTPNLLGYWRFTPESGANSVVNGYTGSFEGDARIGPPGSGPPIAGDPDNAALVLDGSGDSLISSGVKPLLGQIGEEGTIMAWFKLAALPSASGRFFAIAGESQFTNDFDIGLLTDDRIRFWTEAGAHTAAPAPFTASDLDTWHFVAGTFKAGVRDGRVLYLDGVPVAATTAGGHGLNEAPFYIGESPVFPGRHFPGMIDEVAVFNRALTAAEIAGIHAGKGTAIESFFLPKTVKAKRNASDAAKSTLKAVGVLDTGPRTPQLASAATLDVGGLHFDIPALAQDGGSFVFAAPGVDFAITPNPYGSSRAKFKLSYTGDLTGKVALDGPLALAFANAAADGGCTVNLGGGVFGLGKVRGSLVEPNLFVLRARATLKGPGQDALSVIVGLATGGAVPAQASDLTIGFGGGLSATIPAASFRRVGTRDVFAGNVGGITKVTVDHAREQIAIAGKGLALGTFAEGGNEVLLRIGLGPDSRAVRVRMGRKGALMKY